MTTTQQINVGTAPNDNTGDPIRTGGQIINENTLKLWHLSNKVDVGLMQVHKFTGNTDITQIEVNDFVSGVVVDNIAQPPVTAFIVSQFIGGGSVNDFGTVAGNFNDDAYKTSSYLLLDDIKTIVAKLRLKDVDAIRNFEEVLILGVEGYVQKITKADFITEINLNGFLQNVVEDLTPQLGGHLDVNGKDITGTGSLGLNGSGEFVGFLRTQGLLQADAEVHLTSFPSSRYDGASSNYLYTDGTGALQSGSIKALVPQALQKEINANYTLQNIDNTQTIWINSATPITITVPNLSDNFECFFYNNNVGAVTFIGSAITLGTPDGTILKQDKICIIIKKQNTTTFKLKGELE